jgi:hypothetical protein
MPATVYAELHNPQSGLRHQRGVGHVQLGHLDGDLGRQVRDRTPARKVDGQ